MAARPTYTNVPVIGFGAISSANTARDGSGTIVDILTGNTLGTRIKRIIIQATVTTTAGMVRLFIYSGGTYKLWREIAVTAITVSASVAGFTSTIDLIDERALILPSGYKLAASTHNAEAFNVIAEGADF